MTEKKTTSRRKIKGSTLTFDDPKQDEQDDFDEMLKQWETIKQNDEDKKKGN